MINKYPQFIEIVIFIIAFILGPAVAALIAQPIDRFFLTNFSYYWGSQLCVLLIVLAFKPSLSILGGVAFALALYLGAFHTWFFVIRHCDAMGWLAYFFSLPGALVGAIIAIVRLRKRMPCSVASSSVTSAGYTLAGAFINLAVECVTIFYCF